MEPFVVVDLLVDEGNTLAFLEHRVEIGQVMSGQAVEFFPQDMWAEEDVENFSSFVFDLHTMEMTRTGGSKQPALLSLDVR